MFQVITIIASLAIFINAILLIIQYSGGATVPDIDFAALFQSIWRLAIVTAALPLLSSTLGVIVATLLRLDISGRKAVAFEVGIQNVPLALTLIILSYTGYTMVDLILVPMLYGTFAALEGLAAVILWKCYTFVRTKCSDRKHGEDETRVQKPDVPEDIKEETLEMLNKTENNNA